MVWMLLKIEIFPLSPNKGTGYPLDLAREDRVADIPDRLTLKY